MKQVKAIPSTMIVSAILFISFDVYGQIIDSSPKATMSLTGKDFDRVVKLLEDSKLGRDLDCKFRADRFSHSQTFLTGTKEVQQVKIFYNGMGLVERDMNLKFSEGARWGRKLTNNVDAGLVEDIYIEWADYEKYWMRFMHDGRGKIVYLNFGDQYGVFPCSVSF